MEITDYTVGEILLMIPLGVFFIGSCLGMFVLIGQMFTSPFDISSDKYVEALCRAKTIRRVVALTFDDGPDPERTPEILDVLGRHGVQAMFFVIGSKAEAHPELIRRIVAEGHIVGNHTYSHSNNFPWFKEAKMRDEIHWCDVVLQKIVGSEQPAHILERARFFRPPFGVTNPTLKRALEPWRVTIGWDVRSLDTVSRWPRERVFERVRKRVRPGSVILLHDDREGGARLLEMILNHLSGEGYTVERLDKMFGL